MVTTLRRSPSVPGQAAEGRGFAGVRANPKVGRR